MGTVAQGSRLETFPSSAGATDKTWWTPVWDTASETTALAGATHLVTSDLELSRRLFERALGAVTVEVDHGLEFHWASGALHAVAGPTRGVGLLGR